MASAERVQLEKSDFPEVKDWYRIVFAGDPGIGKTSLLLRFIKDKFTDPQPTIQATPFLKVVTLDDDTKVGMELCDTAGMERHHSVTEHYYRNAHAVLFCYDITDSVSYKDMEHWSKEVHTRLGPHYEKVGKFLVGTKLDLFEETAENERTDKATAFKKAQGMKPAWEFFETSALDNADGNIEALFHAVARNVATMSVLRRETIKICTGTVPRRVPKEEESNCSCKKS